MLRDLSVATIVISILCLSACSTTIELQAPASSASPHFDKCLENPATSYRTAASEPAGQVLSSAELQALKDSASGVGGRKFITNDQLNVTQTARSSLNWAAERAPELGATESELVSLADEVDRLWNSPV